MVQWRAAWHTQEIRWYYYYLLSCGSRENDCDVKLGRKNQNVLYKSRLSNNKSCECDLIVLLRTFAQRCLSSFLMTRDFMPHPPARGSYLMIPEFIQLFECIDFVPESPWTNNQSPFMILNHSLLSSPRFRLAAITTYRHDSVREECSLYERLL